MWTRPAPLAATAAALRSNQLDLAASINEACDRIDAAEPSVQALLPEPQRRARLLADAQILQAQWPDPAARPPLYGIFLGVKDMFRVAGFPTRAGSQLPPELFAGPEAACVSRLRAAGALILGKTVSAEFAYFEPGPTRNPHNLDHTPGGSSSGSAAAVASGFSPLALGTQTIGSVLRPAAFCGLVGFKSTFGRIPTAGLIPCAASFDHVGFFTQDMSGAALVASLLCEGWRPDLAQTPATLPVLGVPEGPYLAQASPEALALFEEQLALLTAAGYRVRRVPALDDIEAINRCHLQLVFAEMAQVHAAWFARYETLYRPRTATAIRDGQSVTPAEQDAARAGQARLRADLLVMMAQYDIDLWVCPAAPGPAPAGIAATGSPLMNLPWTQAGLPAVTFPAGYAANGLPLGLQCVGALLADEYLLACALPMAQMYMERL
ncbi:MAG: amidase [Ktedonobacteraceae bacterium]|nr:amidase [Ktedonobacteraceae bacterium]